MPKKVKRDISYMIDRVKYDGDYTKLNKSQCKILGKLFCTKQYKLPQLAKDYITAYSREMGYCGEIAVSAFSEYIKNEGYYVDHYMSCIFYNNQCIGYECNYYNTHTCKYNQCKFVKC